jgi:chromodomain-helicase-DNA-binding protein 1
VLEGGKAGKDMFDKGELAAILRFGAQNLFQEDTGDAGEVAEVQKRDQQLYEEDIDAILARAEIVDQRAQEEAEDKKNELLSAFNVATFKNDEDDATFWSRLIPEEHRARVPERKGGRKGAAAHPDGEPSARTARRNNAGGGESGKGTHFACHRACSPCVCTVGSQIPRRCSGK